MTQRKITSYVTYSQMTLALSFPISQPSFLLVMFLHLMKREFPVHISGPNIWQELISCPRCHLCLLPLKLQVAI
ncbi:hypothetical protein PS1_043620 [Malus domestica]